jgi:hypothetical protein
MEEDSAELAGLLLKRGKRAFRRYHLKFSDGRLMLVRDELDRLFDLVLCEVCGCDVEPDEKDGTFLD